MHLLTLSVVYHNEQDNLPALLESFSKNFVASQFIPKFLFIDNCSSDSSFEFIERWKIANPWADVENLKRNYNHMADARQQAIDHVQSDWLAFIDGDSILDLNWSNYVTKLISEAPLECVGIGGDSQYQVKKKWHSFALALSRKFPLGKKGKTKVSVDHVPTNNYLVRPEAVKRAGGFDSFFARVGEDLDLNQRLKNIGKIYFDPNFSVDHLLPQSLHKWFVKMAYYGRAQSYILLKYGGGLPITKFIPAGSVLIILVFFSIFPFLALTFSILSLLSARFRFFTLTILFYGLGEWVGAVHFLFSGKLFEGAGSMEA